MAISPDGKLLASASADKTIKLWSLGDGSALNTLDGHADTVVSVAISPDGHFLVSGSIDKTVRLWSLPDGRLLKTLTPFSKKVEGVAITADGKFFAAGSDDGMLVLWSLPDCTLIRTYREPGPILAMAFSPQGDIVAVAPGQTQYRGLKSGFPIDLISLSDGSVRTLVRNGSRSVGVHLGNIVSLTFAKNGRLYSADDSGLINVWSPEGQPALGYVPTGTFGPTTEGLWAVTLSPDGEMLASVAAGDLRLQHVNSFPFSQISKAEQYSIGRPSPLSLVFLPDGKELISGGPDGRILRWSLPELQLIGALTDRRN
jgi:WD40 repeat protein